MSRHGEKTESAHVENETLEHQPPFDYSEELALQGARLQEEERQLGIFESLKRHKRAALICCIAFSAPACFAYDSIANGASLAMPSFFIYFGDIGPTGPYLPSIWTSLWSAMSSLAQAIGASTVGVVSDRFGRKWLAAASALITVVGTAVQFYAGSRGMLLAGKVINGYGLGSLMAVATTYASEVAPLKLKGLIQSALVMSAVIMFCVALGIVRAFVPDTQPSSFRTVFAIQWAVGGLSTIAFAFAPESPIYLIANKKLSAAQKSVAAIYGSDNHVEARTAWFVKTIREEGSHNELQRGTYIECFKGKNLYRTTTACLLYSAIIVGGSPLLTQNILILIIAGLAPIHAFDIGIGGFGLAILIILGSWLLIDKLNRRKVYLFGLSLNIVIMFIIGCLYYAPGTSPLWAVGVLMNLLISFQTSFIQSMAYPIAAEVSSYRLRQKTLSIALTCQTVLNWFITFIVPYMYNVDAGNLGVRSGFVFFGFSVLIMVASWYMVPDLSNLTTEEIDHAYESGIPARDMQQLAHREELTVEQAAA